MLHVWYVPVKGIGKDGQQSLLAMMEKQSYMSEVYEIHIDSHLSNRLKYFFEDMTVCNQEDGTTVLSGEIVDQAALHGLLARVRDLGLTLLNVKICEDAD